MSEHIVIKKSTLIDIADTIRAKSGLTDPIKISDINTENEEIMSNMNLPDLTNPASASHIFEGKEVIDETGNVIVGEMPRNPGAEHEILIDENGLITSNLVFLEDGYISSGERQIENNLQLKLQKLLLQVQVIKLQ